MAEYRDLYVQTDTSLIADVFLNFRSICLEIYELHPVKFLLVSGLGYQAALKKAKVKLDLLDTNMLLIIEKGIREGICHSIY